MARAPRWRLGGSRSWVAVAVVALATLVLGGPVLKAGLLEQQLPESQLATPPRREPRWMTAPHTLSLESLSNVSLAVDIRQNIHGRRFPPRGVVLITERVASRGDEVGPFGLTLLPAIVAGGAEVSPWSDWCGGVGGACRGVPVWIEGRRCPMPSHIDVGTSSKIGMSVTISGGVGAVRHNSLLGTNVPCSSATSMGCTASKHVSSRLRSSLHTSIQRIKSAANQRLAQLQLQYAKTTGVQKFELRATGGVPHAFLRYVVASEVARWVMWSGGGAGQRGPTCLTTFLDGPGNGSAISTESTTRLNLFQCAMDVAVFAEMRLIPAQHERHLCLACHASFQVSPPPSAFKSTYMLPSNPHSPHEALLSKLLSVLYSGELPSPTAIKGDGDGAAEITFAEGENPPMAADVASKLLRALRCLSPSKCVVNIKAAVSHMRGAFVSAVSQGALRATSPPDDVGRLVNDCILDLRPAMWNAPPLTPNPHPGRPLMITGYQRDHFPEDHPLMGGWRHRRHTSLVVDRPSTVVGALLSPQRVLTPPHISPTGYPSLATGFQTVVTKYAKTSWIASHNVCGLCEHRRGKGSNWGSGSGKGAKAPFDFRKYYMDSTSPCVLSLFSVGPTEEGLFHLQNARHDGRSGIYTFREGGFQYAGHVAHPDELVGIARAASAGRDAKSSRVAYLPGTTVLNAAYAGGNIGHTIQDALWGFTQTLLIARLASELSTTNPKSAHSNRSISTSGRGVLPLGGDRRKRTLPDVKEELPFLFPPPLRTLFSNHFSSTSSEYYGAVSTAVAYSVLGADRVVESPFGGPDNASGGVGPHDVLCFETLLAGGIDRNLERGHYNSVAGREAVAHELRRAVFDLMDATPHQLQEHGPHPSLDIRVYVYGRNDVHRRSVRNIATLVVEATFVTALVGLPNPTLISTFDLSPMQQIRMSRGIDVLLTVQGAHMQNSLFMPADAVVIEIGACGSEKVSFLKRYGMYLPTTQRHKFIPLCGENSDFGAAGRIAAQGESDPVSLWRSSLEAVGMTGPGIDNFSEDSVADQNITICPGHMARIKEVLLHEVRELRNKRIKQAQSHTRLE